MAARKTLDPATHQGVLELNKVLGEAEARKVLGNISPETYARALGGLTQQAATLEVIKTRLAAWKAAREART